MNNNKERIISERLDLMDQVDVDDYFKENLLNDDNDTMEWLNSVDANISDQAYYFLQKYHEDALNEFIDFQITKNQSLVNESVYRHMMECF